VNQALSQAESLFKAAITLIQEVPPIAGTDKLVNTPRDICELQKARSKYAVILKRF
jgi:hypothetical protein